jgi:hypothetical protein
MVAGVNSSTQSSTVVLRLRLRAPAIEMQQRWAPVLAVGVDSRADQACDELWTRNLKLVDKEVVSASAKAS